MKTIFQAALRSGNVKLADMLRRIDSYHIQGKLTDAERDELYAEARAGATPEQSTDLFGGRCFVSYSIKSPVPNRHRR